MVFGVGQINGAIYVYPRLTLVAIATRFGTKLAIRNIVNNFASIRGFGDGPSNAADRVPSRPTLVAIVTTKFETKWAITRLV